MRQLRRTGSELAITQFGAALGADRPSGDHTMTESSALATDRRLTTPRAAAISGIVFAVLMITSYTLLQLSIPPYVVDTGEWLEDNVRTVSLAFGLVPFAGIAFLWSMGVLRNRLGYLEDQFFSTLFFGSGFLYLGMTFTAAAVAGGVLTIYALFPEMLEGSAMYIFSRVVIYQINIGYATRMAGMFMFVLGTIWVRTRVMPRWLSFLTYALALVLLFGVGFTTWVTMIFPAWVFLISVLILISNYRGWDDGRARREGAMVEG
jgi:hypothetical protein